MKSKFAEIRNKFRSLLGSSSIRNNLEKRAWSDKNSWELADVLLATANHDVLTFSKISRNVLYMRSNTWKEVLVSGCRRDVCCLRCQMTATQATPGNIGLSKTQKLNQVKNNTNSKTDAQKMNLDARYSLSRALTSFHCITLMKPVDRKFSENYFLCFYLH